MSLNSKSDVKNHLSARRHKTPLPVNQTDIAGSSRSEHRNENRDTPAVRQESGLRFYAVSPVSPVDALVSSGNSTDESTVKKPQL